VPGRVGRASFVSAGNGLRRDRKDREGLGMRLADFVAHRSARKAELTEAHIVALRLYSSAAFRTINGPLRDQRRDTPHPLAATVAYLAEAIKKLRAVDTDSRTLDLWRGMRNLQSTEAFQNNGGTEPAPMSTTSDLNIAVGYALSEYSLLFKVVADSFMQRGADISFLSCFPSEREYVYPPLYATTDRTHPGPRQHGSGSWSDVIWC